MILALRCPSCLNLSRVGAEAVGRTVACPHCGRPFAAAPEPAAGRAPDPVPVVYPARPAGPSPTVVGLALVPLGIPLLWLAGPVLTGVEPVFSFAAPVALAVGLVGLGLGVGFAHGWSAGTRVRAVLALVLVGYFAGGFLYFLKKEWAEAVRRHVGPPAGDWQEFREPGGRYQVRAPGRPEPAADARPLPGWDLTVYRLAPGKNAPRDTLGEVYEVAHGPAPADAAGLRPDDWFARARDAVRKGCDGEVARERPVTDIAKLPGREYVLALPDGTTNRVVRVYRAGDRAFYLGVEGAFVSENARYVQTFFRSFVAPAPAPGN